MQTLRHQAPRPPTHTHTHTRAHTRTTGPDRQLGHRRAHHEPRQQRAAGNHRGRARARVPARRKGRRVQCPKPSTSPRRHCRPCPQPPPPTPRLTPTPPSPYPRRWAWASPPSWARVSSLRDWAELSTTCSTLAARRPLLLPRAPWAAGRRPARSGRPGWASASK